MLNKHFPVVMVSNDVENKGSLEIPFSIFYLINATNWAQLEISADSTIYKEKYVCEIVN